MARPTKYSEELANRIVDMMGKGMSVREIGRRDDMPTATCIHMWAGRPDHPFFTHYGRGRELQAQAWADEIVEIADEGRNDWVERQTKTGEVEKALDREHVQRSALRVDVRKWLLGKLHPKTYAERLGTMGPDGKLIDPTKLTIEDQRTAISDLIGAAVKKASDGENNS